MCWTLFILLIMGNCFRFVASIFRQADSLVCHQKILLIFRYQFLRPLSYNGAQNVLFCMHWIAKRRKWTKNYTERKLETATFDLVSIFQIDELKSCVSAFARLPTFEIRFFAVIIFAYSFASSFYYSVKPRENEVDLIFSW